MQRGAAAYLQNAFFNQVYSREVLALFLNSLSIFSFYTLRLHSICFCYTKIVAFIFISSAEAKENLWSHRRSNNAMNNGCLTRQQDDFFSHLYSREAPSIFLNS